MRIIAGEHRGRRIQAPEGESTRPMLDRVRESLFGILGERIEGARVLDLFAGSGSLGLEALSRGAACARMVEREPRTVRLLRENIQHLGLADRAQAVRGDALSPRTWRPVDGKDAGEGYTIVFLDPPYPMLAAGTSRLGVLDASGELAREVLAPGGVIVLHAPRGLLRREDFRALESEMREYGSNALWFLRPPPPKAPAERER